MAPYFTYRIQITYKNMEVHKCIGMKTQQLTPKGLACDFWQHRNVGHIPVTRDLHISG